MSALCRIACSEGTGIQIDDATYDEYEFRTNFDNLPCCPVEGWAPYYNNRPEDFVRNAVIAK